MYIFNTITLPYIVGDEPERGSKRTRYARSKRECARLDLGCSRAQRARSLFIHLSAADWCVRLYEPKSVLNGFGFDQIIAVIPFLK